MARTATARKVVSVPAPAALAIEMWPIARIVPYEMNARKIPRSAVDKVAQSLREYGWRQPIVVDASGVIVVGHVRRLGAIQNGWTEAPVHVAGDLTAEQIRAYRLADNRAHDEAAWDYGLLGTELLDLKGLAKFDLASTGFDAKEIIKLTGATLPAQPQLMQSASLEFRVVVDCAGEAHQTELLQRFKDEGLKCRALIS